MELRFGVISVDDHVVEPPDLWTRCMSHAKWGDRIPHVAAQANGTERWVIDGRVSASNSLAPAGALSDDRGSEPQAWSQVPKSAYEPQARLAAMDSDGVDCSVLYPSAAGISGEEIGAIKDLELQVECARIYNDWIIEVWAAASPRFVPQAILPAGSVEAATAEAKRAVGRGHKGVIMPAQPSQINPASPHLYKPDWDAAVDHNPGTGRPRVLPRRKRAQRDVRNQPGLRHGRCSRIRQRAPGGRQRSVD